MKKVGRGVVVSLGLSACKHEVRVVAAYGLPLVTSDGDQVALVTWVVRRSVTADGVRIWEGEAYRESRGGDRLRLRRLDDQSVVHTKRLSTLLRMLGIARSMRAPSLLGAQQVLVHQRDGQRTDETLEDVRRRPSFAELASEEMP